LIERLLARVNEWNKISQDVADAPLVNMFKNRLDRHTGTLWAFEAV